MQTQHEFDGPDGKITMTARNISDHDVYFTVSSVLHYVDNKGKVRDHQVQVTVKKCKEGLGFGAGKKAVPWEPATVNWSAMGDQDPKTAEHYSVMLKFASDIARELDKDFKN
ncbi:Uncharacterised protein [uncultured archaeon]|nr:Uncharacterised protein [uncultured archaeon]